MNGFLNSSNQERRRRRREYQYDILPSKVTIFSLPIYKTTSHNRTSTHSGITGLTAFEL